MKSEKGVTLVSLGIYIVIILIALITLGTITAYFRSNVNEFNTKTTVDLEFDKFNLYFIEEVKKTNNKIDETNSTETKIVFSSGNIYEFSDNSIILNGNVKIAEKIEACTFSFTTNENDLQYVTVYIKVGETERNNEYSLSNQTTENVDNEDYIYGYKRVVGTDKLTLDNAIKTNLKNYKIHGNSVQDGTPTPTNHVEIQSVGDKTKNILEYPYADTTKNNNGIVWTDNGDGTVTANGTATGNSFFSLPTTWYDWKGLTPGKTYYISGCPEGGSLSTYFIGVQDSAYSKYSRDFGEGVSYTADNNPVYMFLTIRSGTTVNNLTFKPMLSLEPIDGKYEPYGYKIPVKVSGKNLLNPDTVKEDNNYIVSSSGKEWTPSATGGTWRVSDFIPIMEGRTYNLNAVNNNASAAGMAWYNSNKTYISGLNTTQINSNNGNMTAPSGAKYLRVSWRIDEGYNPDWKNTVQLEEGTEATEHEPYVEPKTINIYLDEPLRKVGNYADYIDFENQKLVRNIKLGTLTTNGTSGVGSNSEDIVRFYYTKFSDRKISENKEIAVLATGLSHLSYSEYSNKSSSDLQSIAGGPDNRAVFFKISKTLIGGDTIEACKTYLAQNPITIHYILETPTEEFIELPNLLSYKGTTTIRIDTEIPPSNTEVVYYSK